MSNCNGGIKLRSNTSKQFDSAVETGTLYREQIVVGNILMQRHRFNRQKRKYTWLDYHSKYAQLLRDVANTSIIKGGNVHILIDCRSHDNNGYTCAQWSIQFGTNQYSCNDYSQGAVRNCHDLYHRKNKNMKRILMTTITIVNSYSVILLLLLLLLLSLSLSLCSFLLYLRVIIEDIVP